jgi:4-carboxymuconolactone decarboxylase
VTRLPHQLPDHLSAEARLVYDSIAGGARAKSRAFPLTTADGGLLGPFNAMLYSPAVGDALQRLGAAIRFESSLADDLRELAILLVARQRSSDFEWWAHERVGRSAGLDDATIEAVRSRRRPDLDGALAHGFDLCTEILESGTASDTTYHRAVDALGEQAVMELVTLLGYYTTLAMLLSVFEVGVPDGEPSPFG